MYNLAVRNLDITNNTIFTSPYTLESVPYLSDPEDLLLVSQDSGQLTCSGSNVSCLTEDIHTLH